MDGLVAKRERVLIREGTLSVPTILRTYLTCNASEMTREISFVLGRQFDERLSISFFPVTGEKNRCYCGVAILFVRCFSLMAESAVAKI